MDDIGAQPPIDPARRRRIREERRAAARRKGHVRLAIAVCTLLIGVIVLCWTASAVRSCVSARQASGQASSADQPPATQPPGESPAEVASQASSSENPKLAVLAPIKAVLGQPRMGVLSGLPSMPINTKFAGMTMFRGNATRTYYGEGPVPKNPRVLWRFPEDGVMSAMSSEGGAPKYWAGTGWTGQPNVVERGGRTEIIFGAYDKKIHFLDAATGKRVRPDFATGDIIKGTVTSDPDGYPLLYSGSRDNYYRAIALDRAEPTELWSLSAYSVKNQVWNDDWDGNGVIRDGYLFEGGENSHFFVIRLNRSYGKDRKVRVKPKVVFDFEGFDQELFDAIGDKEVSIENSPALYKGRVYFSNSGGLVWGLDISGLKRGRRPRPVFRFWTGDDTDASIVVGDDGMLYVGSEVQRHNETSRRNGQIMKLNPYKPKNPLVWGVKVPPSGGDDGLGGVWATPTLHGDMIYEPTHPGALLGINKNSGKVIWRKPFTWHAWGSASVVDDTLIVPDTNGTLHAYDVGNPRVNPPELWRVSVPGGGAIESTPVLWKGRIYVGSRDGHFYCFGDK